MAAVTTPPPGLTWGALVLVGLTAVGSFYHDYTHNDREIVQRVSALEAQRQDDRDTIAHIRDQVDKLVTWALGDKNRANKP